MGRGLGLAMMSRTFRRGKKKKSPESKAKEKERKEKEKKEKKAPEKKERKSLFTSPPEVLKRVRQSLAVRIASRAARKVEATVEKAETKMGKAIGILERHRGEIGWKPD